jgi:hypothetical protein
MIKKILKGVSIFVLLVVVSVGGWATVNRKHIGDLATMNSAWYAQMTCSCIFVTKRSEKECKHYTRQILPYSSIVIDRKSKSVTATATAITLYGQSTAKYEGPRHGCRLVNK